MDIQEHYWAALVHIGLAWMDNVELGLKRSHSGTAPFLFLHFSKKKFTEIYFWIQVLQFYTPAARQGGGRGPTARQVGGRDLYINKNKIFLRRGPWREPAAPLPGGRPPPQI